MRRTRYQEIADELRTRLATGELGAGRLLPSESELSNDYAASRVTVRRALEVLRDEGLVDSRQGFGWFVAADPVRQSLGRLGTIESQLAAEGVHSERRVLDFRFVAAPARVREVLDCETVLRVRRLNLADGEPFALVTVWCPERVRRGAVAGRRRAVAVLRADRRRARRCGADHRRGGRDARTMPSCWASRPASPVLRCERIDVVDRRSRRCW